MMKWHEDSVRHDYLLLQGIVLKIEEGCCIWAGPAVVRTLHIVACLPLIVMRVRSTQHKPTNLSTHQPSDRPIDHVKKAKEYVTNDRRIGVHDWIIKDRIYRGQKDAQCNEYDVAIFVEDLPAEVGSSSLKANTD